MIPVICVQMLEMAEVAWHLLVMVILFSLYLSLHSCVTHVVNTALRHACSIHAWSMRGSSYGFLSLLLDSNPCGLMVEHIVRLSTHVVSIYLTCNSWSWELAVAIKLILMWSVKWTGGIFSKRVRWMSSKHLNVFLFGKRVSLWKSHLSTDSQIMLWIQNTSWLDHGLGYAGHDFGACSTKSWWGWLIHQFILLPDSIVSSLGVVKSILIYQSAPK